MYLVYTLHVFGINNMYVEKSQVSINYLEIF